MKFDEIQIFVTEDVELDYISFLLDNGEVTGTCAENNQFKFGKGECTVHVFEDVELDLPNHSYFDIETDTWKKNVNTKVALESIVGISEIQSCVDGKEQCNALKVVDVLFFRRGAGKCFSLNRTQLQYVNK